MSSSESRLRSGEGTVGFEMSSDLFVNLAFEDFRKAGQDGYRSVTVYRQSKDVSRNGMLQLKSEVYIHFSQIHLNSVFHNS